MYVSNFRAFPRILLLDLLTAHGVETMQCPKKVCEVMNYLVAQEPSILFNILNRLPKMGIGRQVTRNTWSIQDKDNFVRPAYWTITKVIPNKDMRSGKVWGTFAPRRCPCLKVRSVRSIERMQWLLLPKAFDNRNLRAEPHVSAKVRAEMLAKAKSDQEAATIESQAGSDDMLAKSEEAATTESQAGSDMLAEAKSATTELQGGTDMLAEAKSATTESQPGSDMLAEAKSATTELQAGTDMLAEAKLDQEAATTESQV